MRMATGGNLGNFYYVTTYGDIVYLVRRDDGTPVSLANGSRALADNAMNSASIRATGAGRRGPHGPGQWHGGAHV